MRLILFLLVFLLPLPAHAETIAGRATVIDGDTVEIHGERIRILDIDAPESKQLCFETGGIDNSHWRCGAFAANKLADWIGARTVTCETTKKDRYKRWLARCSVGGEDIAVWLAEGGWVFPYRDCKCENIRDAVGRAKAAQLGIWSGRVEEPWEWRAAQ